MGKYVTRNVYVSGRVSPDEVKLLNAEMREAEQFAVKFAEDLFGWHNADVIDADERASAPPMTREWIVIVECLFDGSQHVAVIYVSRRFRDDYWHACQSPRDAKRWVTIGGDDDGD